MSRRYLYVPFEEREQVRALGALWDHEAKCWYIGSGANEAHFGRWLGDHEEEEEFAIVSSRAFVASTSAECWRCHTRTEVVCVYCEAGEICSEPYERFTVSNITATDEALRRQLASWPSFRYTTLRGGVALVNHCTHCGARQEDYYLHCEPSGPFFSLRNALAPVRLTALQGTIRLTGDEGFEPDPD